MNTDHILMIILSVLALGLNISMVILIHKIHKWYQSGTKNELPDKHRDDVPQYTDSCIKTIELICNNVASVKWRGYRDSHKIEKLTKEQLKKLAQESAIKASEMINYENFDYDNLLFNKSYVSWLTVSFTLHAIKHQAENDIEVSYIG